MGFSSVNPNIRRTENPEYHSFALALSVMSAYMWLRGISTFSFLLSQPPVCRPPPQSPVPISLPKELLASLL
jgi:hypothetical protein